MICLYALVSLLGVCRLLALLFAPWATYVRHSAATSKYGYHVFLTVKRTRWYPPFLSYEETWHSNETIYPGSMVWQREHDGAPDGEYNLFAISRRDQLSSILWAAIGREVSRKGNTGD